MARRRSGPRTGCLLRPIASIQIPVSSKQEEVCPSCTTFWLRKNKVPFMGGNAVKKKEKKRVLTLCRLGLFLQLKKTESTKSKDFLSMSETLLFFRAEIFGLLQEKLPLVCGSQGSGYSLRLSKGSLYGVRPDQIPLKCWRWSNLINTLLLSYQTSLSDGFNFSAFLRGTLTRAVFKKEVPICLKLVRSKMCFFGNSRQKGML